MAPGTVGLRGRGWAPGTMGLGGSWLAPGYPSLRLRAAKE